MQLHKGGSLCLSVLGVCLVQLGLLGGVIVPLLLLLLLMCIMAIMPLGGGIPQSRHGILVGLCIL